MHIDWLIVSAPFSLITVVLFHSPRLSVVETTYLDVAGHLADEPGSVGHTRPRGSEPLTGDPVEQQCVGGRELLRPVRMEPSLTDWEVSRRGSSTAPSAVVKMDRTTHPISASQRGFGDLG
ncbi:hypothetical protein [Plantactinospora soyae]|uniref:Uncharacterized protein n=1 Tax=Plantactinospora soyae TaxID=1544732 RepID=A0A927M9V2_9ACTN|nr:hypothetical protein [Plantactinospora soyae]MBE1489620.1 hypothetical protein [Plantactinospora soyae]